jgi:hypothetical protein
LGGAMGLLPELLLFIPAAALELLRLFLVLVET